MGSHALQKVILTGGNGFIGSHLVERLRDLGVTVHAIANTNHQRIDQLLPPSQIHVLRDDPFAAADLVTRIDPDAIFHLAAVYAEPKSVDCIASMIDGNLSLGAALLYGASLCQRTVPFINTGTYWQFSEEGDYSPNTFYASTKQAFQDMLLFYEKQGSVAATTLVLYDTFGSADTRSKLWTTLIHAPEGSRFALSAGDQRIELVHMDDVVRAFLHAATLLLAGQPLAPLYALRSATPVTLKQLIHEFDHRANLGLIFDWGAKPYWEGQVLRPWQGPLLPGWEPRVPVIEELVRMAAEHRSSKVAALHA